jgi:hypothetical protein
VIALSLALAACEPYQEELPPPEWAQVTILNKSNELHQLAFYQPRASILIDDAARQQIARGLSEAHFDLTRPVSTISLFSGQEIGLGDPLFYHNESRYSYNYNYTYPNIWLVKSTLLPSIIIAWDERAEKMYYRDVDVPQEVPADEGTVVIEADYSRADPDTLHPWRYTPCGVDQIWQCDAAQVAEALRVPPGARYTWRSQDAAPLHRDAASATTPRCEVAQPGEQLDWDVRGGGVLEVTSARVGLDGCAAMKGIQEGRAQTWTICAPADMLEVLVPGPGERLIATAQVEDNPFDPNDPERVLTLELRRYVGADVALRAHRLTLRQQTRRVSSPRVDAQLEPDAQSCAPTTSACRADLPARLIVRNAQQTQTLRAGERLTLPDPATTIYLASAGQAITRDRSCRVANGLWMDVVILEVLL